MSTNHQSINSSLTYFLTPGVCHVFFFFGHCLTITSPCQLFRSGVWDEAKDEVKSRPPSPTWALEDVTACSYMVTKHPNNLMISFLLNYIAFSTELFKLHSSLLVNTKTNERSMACKMSLQPRVGGVRTTENTTTDADSRTLTQREMIHLLKAILGLFASHDAT